MNNPDIDTVHLATANIPIDKAILLNWLKSELSQNNDRFRKTDLYKLLKTELSKLGYWKNKERGNPRKGFSRSQQAQQLAQFKQQLYNS